MYILAFIIGSAGIIGSLAIGNEFGYSIGIPLAVLSFVFAAILAGFGTLIDAAKSTEASNRDILHELRDIKKELNLMKEQQVAEKKEEKETKEDNTSAERYTESDKHVCTKCGKEQLKGSRYCIYCGECFEK